MLGSILIDSGNYARVAPYLKAEHFLAEKNRYGVQGDDDAFGAAQRT